MSKIIVVENIANKNVKNNVKNNVNKNVKKERPKQNHRCTFDRKGRVRQNAVADAVHQYFVACDGFFVFCWKRKSRGGD